MKNFLVWIVLIATAALGVAVAQPTTENVYAANASAASKMIQATSEQVSKKV